MRFSCWWGSSSHPFRIEGRAQTGAVTLERAFGADRVGALEDPVLPGRQPAEDLGLHRLRTGEAEVRLEPGERVRREARALLDRDADLVFPIDLVQGRGHEAGLRRGVGIEAFADAIARTGVGVRLAEKTRLEP